MTMEFLELPDLVDRRVGGEVLAANDEFFAPKENLTKPGEAVWLADEYTDRGKWMDGWETRRRREPGYDWAIVRLGLPGILHGVVVDTAYFRGNYPESCSIEACDVPADTSIEALTAPAGESDVVWREILAQSMLEGNSKNHFTIADRGRVTHLRLNIYPDGGVARLRAHGRVLADWQRIDTSGEPVDLVAVASGGRSLACSDECFGPLSNLLLPGTARNIGDGWETRRRRGPGHDWAILQLGAPGVIERAVVDTSHFIGNAPGTCTLEWCVAPADADPKDVHASGAWQPLLPTSKLQPNRENEFQAELLAMEPATHIRFCIHPDGGVARLRLYGRSANALALEAGLGRLRAADDERFLADMLACCGARAWAAAMTRARPFSGLGSLFAHADEIWAGLGHDDWREAFAAHPKIGERKQADAGGDRFARWSADEQAGVDATQADILDQLARANQAYQERFGYIFIVCASGKSAAEMLSILRRRLGHAPDTELTVAAAEQAKITRLRLQKLLLGLAEPRSDRDNQA